MTDRPNNKPKLHWPTALVVSIAIVAVVVTALVGPLTGLTGDALTAMLSAEGVLGALVAGVMRAMLGSGGES